MNTTSNNNMCSRDRSQSAHIICYITHDYISNNRIAQVSPRGGTANGDPPYPRSHPPSFYAKNKN